ncbi:MAG: TonB-dependent receptor plug domain-containing protein, partial [Pseudomonadota bacterium]
MNSVWADTEELETIVVTASKRAQSLHEIDSAVLVRTAAELERAGVNQVADLEKVVPGLVVRTRGNRAYANLSIRGITSPDFYNPSIQVYVDGVPQDVAAMTQQLIDVQRVEVLRGPQGTLYGRNAHGGVVNIVTNRKVTEPRVRLATILADELLQFELSAAGAIGNGGLFGDVAWRKNQEQGRIDDIATGNSDIDETDNNAGKIRLHYLPDNSPFAASLSFSREDTRSYEELYLREALFDALQFDSATQGQQSLLDREVSTVALNLDYTLGRGSLTSVTAWQEREMQRNLFGLRFPEDQETFSQELRLSIAPGERWDTVLGVFYQNAEFARDDDGFPGFFGFSRNQVDKRSFALFGETILAMSETTDLTVGARWSKEEADIGFNRMDPNSTAFSA